MAGRSRAGAMGAWVCVAALSASGCSWLLDTDKLQEGTGPGAAGSGGTEQDAEVPDVVQEKAVSDVVQADTAPEADAGVPCQDHGDCLVAGNWDLCFMHLCNKQTGRCAPPAQWGGPVLRENPAVIEITSGHEQIGLPALLAEGESVYVAAWYKNGATTDALIQRYEPGIEVTKKSFVEMFGGYPNVGGTPGLLVSTISAKKALELLVPTDFSSGLHMCVRRLAVTADLSQALPHDDLCYGTLITDYDADPRRTAPRLLRRSATVDEAMWIQDGELFIKHGLTEKAVKFNGRARSFSPLSGALPLSAAIVEAGDTPGQEATYEWYTGKSGMSSLFAAAPGPRLGTSSFWTGSDTQAFNLVAWSHPAAYMPSTVEYFDDTCTATKCEASATQTSLEQTAQVLFAPSLAGRHNAQPSFLDIAISVVYSNQDASGTQSVAAAQFIRIDDKQAIPINPGYAVLAGNSTGEQLTLPDRPYLLGRIASAMTLDGTIYVAWVQTVNGKEAMFMRSFQVKESCTAP